VSKKGVIEEGPSISGRKKVAPEKNIAPQDASTPPVSPVPSALRRFEMEQQCVGINQEAMFSGNSVGEIFVFAELTIIFCKQKLLKY